MKNVKCNKCGHDFLIESIKRSRFTHQKVSYQLQYFICDKCNTVYPILIADEELQKDIQVVAKIKMQIALEKRKDKPVNSLIRVLEKSVKFKMEKIKKKEMEIKSKLTGTFIYGVQDDKEYIRYRERTERKEN